MNYLQEKPLFSTKQLQLKLNNPKAGIYVISVVCIDGETFQARVVIQ